MKILHIVPSYKPAYVYGGPIESVARLCEGLAAQGHDVDVFTTTANGKTELNVMPGSTVDVDGVNVTYFKRITKDPTHVSPALWKHLFYHVKEYDVVHIHSWWNILVMVAAKICLLKGAKTIIAPRGMLSSYIFNSGNSKAKKLMHSFFGRSILSKSFFHATSEAEYKECTSLIENWKGFMLPNILSLPELKIADKNNEVFTVIFMSRIHPKKGIEILFKAIANLSFAVKLKIAGAGEDEYITKLKQLADDIHIADKIEWLGWQNRDQKFKELMNADLFALISYNENFANVVIESLHAGTAALVTEQVALSDFVEENDLGWVTTLDADDVTVKLTDAYHDKAKRDRIAKTGSHIIAKYFSVDKLIADYINIYKSI